MPKSITYEKIKDVSRQSAHKYLGAWKKINPKMRPSMYDFNAGFSAAFEFLLQENYIELTKLRISNPQEGDK